LASVFSRVHMVPLHSVSPLVGDHTCTSKRLAHVTQKHGALFQKNGHQFCTPAEA